MVVKSKKSKNPPIFSHEFIIQNHADIVAVVAMIFILGLMVEFLNPLASSFVLLQHNVTREADENVDEVISYRNGPKDMLAAFFYTLIMIILHAVLQEFVLDKFNKKLHLSKVKFAKFHESGQLAAFYLVTFGFAVNLMVEENYLTNISTLWSDYPDSHRLMPWSVKLFYILNIAYWIHVYPELYFQKTKKEDMSPKILYASLYLAVIISGYAMNFTRVMLVLLGFHYLVEGVFHLARLFHFLEKKEVANLGFKLWSVLFMAARLASVSISVLTFWFGLGRVHAASPSFETSLVVRISALAGVCILQFWMIWNFINFYMRRSKEAQEQNASSQKPQKKNKSKADNANSYKKKN